MNVQVADNCGTLASRVFNFLQVSRKPEVCYVRKGVCVCVSVCFFPRGVDDSCQIRTNVSSAGDSLTTKSRNNSHDEKEQHAKVK